jgi:diacylglycerol kinase family enzyme
VRGFLLINPRAGSERPTTGELGEEARCRGVDVHVLRAGEDAVEIARKADADALGIAGGDGSLASVAAVAVERELPFVCVPFGTRNHFARDLGLDRNDPLGALDAFAGRERRIDLGRAGDRPFVNNVSLGLYATLVHRRERHRRRRQLFAGMRALSLSVGRRSTVWATLDHEPVRARVLLVGNNAYELDLFSLGARSRLDEGLLHVYAARGVLPHAWEERKGREFGLEAPAGRLEAAVDGEPVVLDAPLHFAIQPRALRVLVPRLPI